MNTSEGIEALPPRPSNVYERGVELTRWGRKGQGHVQDRARVGMEPMAHVEARGTSTFGREHTRKWAERKREEEKERWKAERERDRVEKERRKRRKVDGRRAEDHEQQREWMRRVKEAPTLKPTWEEFQDPIRFLREAHAQHGAAGVCKVIPPVQATVPASQVLLNQQQKLPAKVQKLPPTRDQGQQNRKETQDGMQHDPPSTVHAEGKVAPPRFQSSKNVYTLAEFENAARMVATRKLGTGACATTAYLESEYWSTMEGDKRMQVEYAGDVEGTGFSDCPEDPLASSPWNLNRLPKLRDSLLHCLDEEIPGVTKPMLYVGMLFSTFAWHVEDHNMYSINYHHMGAPKTWYGVGAGDADAFDCVVQETVYTEAKDKIHASGGLMEKTTMFSPKLLLEKGIRVYRIVQQPGEFVVTFPRAYHGGFSNGFNIGEAVNFATSDWLPYGMDACQRYAIIRRLPVLPHEEMVFHAARQACPKDHPVHSPKEGTITTPPTRKIASLDTVLIFFFGQEINRMLRLRDELHASGASFRMMPQQSRTLLCSRCVSLCYYGIVLCRCHVEPVCMADAVAIDCHCKGDRTVYIHESFVQAVALTRCFQDQASFSTKAPIQSLYLDGSFSHHTVDNVSAEGFEGEHCGLNWDEVLDEQDRNNGVTANAAVTLQRDAFERLLTYGLPPNTAVFDENKGVGVPRFSAQCKVCGTKPPIPYGSLDFCSEQCARCFYATPILHKDSPLPAPVTPSKLSGTRFGHPSRESEHAACDGEGLGKRETSTGCSGNEREGLDQDVGCLGRMDVCSENQELLPFPSRTDLPDAGGRTQIHVPKRARNSCAHLQRGRYSGLLSLNPPVWISKDVPSDHSLRLFRLPTGQSVILASELLAILGVRGQQATNAFLQDRMADPLPARANCEGTGHVRRGAWVFTREDCMRLSRIMDVDRATYCARLADMDWSTPPST